MVIVVKIPLFYVSDVESLHLLKYMYIMNYGWPQQFDGYVSLVR